MVHHYLQYIHVHYNIHVHPLTRWDNVCAVVVNLWLCLSHSLTHTHTHTHSLSQDQLEDEQRSCLISWREPRNRQERGGEKTTQLSPLITPSHKFPLSLEESNHARKMLEYSIPQCQQRTRTAPSYICMHQGPSTPFGQSVSRQTLMH